MMHLDSALYFLNINGITSYYSKGINCRFLSNITRDVTTVLFFVINRIFSRLFFEDVKLNPDASVCLIYDIYFFDNL